MTYIALNHQNEVSLGDILMLSVSQTKPGRLTSREAYVGSCGIQNSNTLHRVDQAYQRIYRCMIATSGANNHERMLSC